MLQTETPDDDCRCRRHRQDNGCFVSRTWSRGRLLRRGLLCRSVNRNDRNMFSAPSLPPSGLTRGLPVTGMSCSISYALEGLIILDNCEHLIEETAEVADCILQGAPEVRILVTSREALKVAGEDVLRLPLLDFAPEQPGPTASEVLDYPAVQFSPTCQCSRRRLFTRRRRSPNGCRDLPQA